MQKPIRLGVNIDHVATLRNARGGLMPDPLRAARLVSEAGGDGVTVHLREDRRHIVDEDIRRIRGEIGLPLNLEMAATAEMTEIAAAINTPRTCIVPERREELTTEGGLDAVGKLAELAPWVKRLSDVGVQVALFLDPEQRQLEAARDIGAHVVELHTGEYCNATGDNQAEELARLVRAAALVVELGMECHAGHGLTLKNVGPVAQIPEVVELNIGHAIIAEAVFDGLEAAIRAMREAMDQARMSVA